MDNANILITGGAGFIGSHIVENLIDKKCKKIRILDNLSTGNKENIIPFLKYDNAKEKMYDYLIPYLNEAQKILY